MELQTRLRLSFYKEIAEIDTAHNIRLVQHTVTGKIFVKKALSIYDLQVFQYLMTQKIPGTPKIEELIEENTTLYVIEEYISGNSLEEILAKVGTFSEEKAADYILRICRILQPLHQQHPPMIHRDLKPSNLILTYDGRLILVDFNSAKTYHPERSQDTVLFGTAGYAAPEQYGFSPSAPAADIYALGVLFHKMLTGDLPGEGNYSGKFSGVIAKCIKIDPKNRYDSVASLQKAIEKIQKPPLTLEQLQIPEKYQGYALPGFRSRKKGYMIAASIWYFCLVIGCLFMESDNVVGIRLIPYQIISFLMLFSLTLWLGNYRGIWYYFPLCRHRNPVIRFIAIVFFAYVWIFLMMMILAFILDAFPA